MQLGLKGVPVAEPTAAVPSDARLVEEALDDLRSSREEAQEEDFPTPSPNAIANAERLIKQMHAISQRRLEVYPTPDGEIAIDAPNGRGRSVLVLCDSEGGALCLVHLDGNHRRARYSTAMDLPDGFLHKALADLDRS